LLGGLDFMFGSHQFSMQAAPPHTLKEQQSTFKTLKQGFVKPRCIKYQILKKILCAYKCKRYWGVSRAESKSKQTVGNNGILSKLLGSTEGIKALTKRSVWQSCLGVRGPEVIWKQVIFINSLSLCWLFATIRTLEDLVDGYFIFYPSKLRFTTLKC
jgi:hypothetical protein